ncbi:MAG: N-acetyltransferase, partial [Pseudomonas sp.]|nr:N-acetyltransferase [Pseudomonas sp.]
MLPTYLNSIHEVAASQWDDLLTQAQPFLRHAFLATLEDSGSIGGRTGWQPRHAVLLGEQGQLLAAMPAYVKSHSYGEYVFDHGWADACHRAGIDYYPKLLGAIPFSPVTGQRLLGTPSAAGQLLDEITTSLAQQGLSSLHINFTTETENALLQGREGWLQRLGCQFHWRNRGYRDFQDFLDALSSRKRKQMRKEREQVAGQGIEFEWREGQQLSELEWDFVYLCYANT